jgi:transposase-like protein
MNEAREEVLAFRHFPAQHWKKVWSTNLLERVNKEIKRRTRVVGIIPNAAGITRLVGPVLQSLASTHHFRSQLNYDPTRDLTSQSPSFIVEQ